MKTQDELVGEQIAAQMIARIDAATARPAETNPAAMTERLIDAAIYADSASGAYVGPARKEVNDARATIEAALEERDALREALAARSAEPVAWEVFQDEGYFGMWCVREVGASRFGDGFHVVSQEEARALKSILCAHPKEAPDV